MHIRVGANGSSGNLFNVSSAGTSKLLINSSGNVGIGTDSIGKTLTVGGSGLRVQSTASADFYSTGQDALVVNNGTGNLRFWNNGSERIRIDSSGNVGIKATTINDGDLQIGNTNSAFNIALAGTRAKFGFSGINAIVQGGVGKGIAFCVNNGTLASGEAARFDSSGNLGIGTDSPSSTLHIKTSVDNSLSQGLVIERSANTDKGYINYQGGAFQIRATDGDPIAFGQVSNERMRIDSSGNLLVGTTSTDRVASTGITLNPAGFIDISRSGTIAGRFSRLGSDGSVIDFRKDGTTVGSISVTGSATAYNTSSDGRLKDITGSAKGLEVINELNPVSYNWKADGKADEGLIAQEVLDIVPNAVSGSEEDMYSMDYSKLVVHLVAGMKEQQTQIEALQSEINLLKGE